MDKSSTLASLILVLFAVSSFATAQRNMSEIITDCCGRGVSFASMGQNCSGMAGLPDISYENRAKCEAVFMSCCHQQRDSVSCDEGILLRLSDGDCDLFPQQESCSYSAGKECCDCCGLGIQAYHMGMACDSMNINTPCDHAFESCCQTTRQEYDVTPTSPASNPCLTSPCSQSCQVVGSDYQCICAQGYRLALDRITCLDINECIELSEPCAQGQECRNSDGSFFCREDPVVIQPCPTGMTFDAVSSTCIDIDECLTNADTCGPDEDCINVQGHYICRRRIPTPVCPRGLRYNPSLGMCRDVDECVEGIHNCPIGSPCVNVFRGYRCESRVCPDGYQVDSVTRRCIDINECYQNSDVCPEGQRCENSEGSYRCVRRFACGTGYNVNAITQECEDINECEQRLHRCQPYQRCVNELGSHICENCPAGYRVDVRNECNLDIDECAEGTDSCTSRQICYNTPGAFTCTCYPGFTYDPLLQDCYDIDECNPDDGTSPCHPYQMCINLPGEYDCRNMCSYGARYIYGTCIDIDECAEGTHQCEEMQECINQEGGHLCRCPLGYRLTRSASGCEDIDECTALPTSCRGGCENTDGSYRCLCPDGYTLNENGYSCNDIDECTQGTDTCTGEDEECFNTLGSYKCRSIECPQYFERRLAGNQRECVKNKALCPEGDEACLKDALVKYTYTALSLPSMPYISSSIRLLTIDINKSYFSRVTFNLIHGNERGYFSVQKRGTNRSTKARASVILTRAISGPYETDLHLEVRTITNGKLSSVTIIIIHIDIGANVW